MKPEVPPRRYRKRASPIAVLALVWLSAGCRSAGALPSSAGTPSLPGCPAGERLEQISSGGDLREYLIHVPSKLPKDSPAALVLGFHGNGSTAGDFASYSGFLALSNREGFLVVYPQGSGEFPTWDTDPIKDNADVEFVHDLIAELETRCNVDPARIYATGHSRGGGMANRLACDLSGEIAAVGPVSGTYPAEGGCHPARPVAIVAFHGDADPDVPYYGIKNQSGPPETYFSIGVPVLQWASAWAARNGCAAGASTILEDEYLTGLAWSGCLSGGDVVFYTIPGGGHGWPGGPASFNSAEMIWNFFVAHPLKMDPRDG